MSTCPCHLITILWCVFLIGIEYFHLLFLGWEGTHCKSETCTSAKSNLHPHVMYSTHGHNALFTHIQVRPATFSCAQMHSYVQYIPASSKRHIHTPWYNSVSPVHRFALLCWYVQGIPWLSMPLCPCFPAPIEFTGIATLTLSTLRNLGG